VAGAAGAAEAVFSDTDVQGFQTLTLTLILSLTLMLAYAKASKALGLIARTISYECVDVLLRLYKSLVRPHLEILHLSLVALLREEQDTIGTRAVPNILFVFYSGRIVGRIVYSYLAE